MDIKTHPMNTAKELHLFMESLTKGFIEKNRLGNYPRPELTNEYQPGDLFEKIDNTHVLEVVVNAPENKKLAVRIMIKFAIQLGNYDALEYIKEHAKKEFEYIADQSRLPILFWLAASTKIQNYDQFKTFVHLLYPDRDHIRTALDKIHVHNYDNFQHRPGGALCHADCLSIAVHTGDIQAFEWLYRLNRECHSDQSVLLDTIHQGGRDVLKAMAYQHMLHESEYHHMRTQQQQLAMANVFSKRQEFAVSALSIIVGEDLSDIANQFKFWQMWDFFSLTHKLLSDCMKVSAGKTDKVSMITDMLKKYSSGDVFRLFHNRHHHDKAVQLIRQLATEPSQAKTSLLTAFKAAATDKSVNQKGHYLATLLACLIIYENPPAQILQLQTGAESLSLDEFAF